MTDIAIQLRLIAEDLAKAQGYSGYVRTLIESGAEIERLRKTVRVMQEAARSKNKQKGKRHGEHA